jgi:predicted nucleotidyltransferase
MASGITNPTPNAEVNFILNLLRSEVQQILGNQLVGMYLYGSLALGDFDRQKSDIDFVVVTDGELSDELMEVLKVMHRRLAASGSKWAYELEGSYIPQKALRRYNPYSVRHPHIDRGGGSLSVEQHDSDWVIQRYILREHGIILAGPDPKTIIDPILPDDLRQAVLDLLWWWELQMMDTRRLETSNYQAYAVLSMCRLLYTMEYGTIVSKPEAARWALRTAGEERTALIERALAWQPGMELDRLNQTLDFIRNTLARCRQSN